MPHVSKTTRVLPSIRGERAAVIARYSHKRGCTDKLAVSRTTNGRVLLWELKSREGGF